MPADMQLLLMIAGQIVTAGAIYGGIRADIRNLHARVAEAVQATAAAHARIDQLFDRRAHHDNQT